MKSTNDMEAAVTNHLKNLPLEDSPFLIDEHGPVFILGCPRSGTTFLSQCVGAIRGVEQFVGILAPPRLMHLLGSLPPDAEPLVNQILLCVRDTFWNAFWRRRYFKDERLIQLLRRNASIKDFMAKPSMDGAIFCYKEPFLCFAAAHFAKFFKNSRFIHIVRDGRDNADSLERKYPDALSDEVLQSEELAENKASEIGVYRRFNSYLIPWWVQPSAEKQFIASSRYGRCVWMWRAMTERARAVKEVTGPERYFEIRYEDFVRAPMDWSEKILRFLGKEMSAAMRRKLSKAYPTSIGISAKRQSQEKIDIANRIAGDLLNSLGYKNE